MRLKPTINISVVEKKMSNPPKAQRLYSMIYGDEKAMTRKQVREVIKIVKKDHSVLLRHLSKMASISRLD